MMAVLINAKFQLPLPRKRVNIAEMIAVLQTIEKQIRSKLAFSFVAFAKLRGLGLTIENYALDQTFKNHFDDSKWFFCRPT